MCQQENGTLIARANDLTAKLQEIEGKVNKEQALNQELQ
jgi:hypothetical protein